MSDLCGRLQDVNEAGVYHLSCPVDVLRDGVARSGFLFFEVDLGGRHGKGEFLAAVAAAVRAPAWFGHNLDALADALGDLSWLDDGAAPGYVLLLSQADERFGLNAADHEAVMRIFEDTVGYWRTKDRPFWVFFR